MGPISRVTHRLRYEIIETPTKWDANYYLHSPPRTLSTKIRTSSDILAESTKINPIIVCFLGGSVAVAIYRAAITSFFTLNSTTLIFNTLTSWRLRTTFIHLTSSTTITHVMEEIHRTPPIVSLLHNTKCSRCHYWHQWLTRRNPKEYFETTINHKQDNKIWYA